MPYLLELGCGVSNAGKKGKEVCVFKKEQFIKMSGKKRDLDSSLNPFSQHSKKSQHFALQGEKLSDNKF